MIRPVLYTALFLTALLAVPLALPTAATAQDETAGMAGDPAEGAETYRLFCATCHGGDATGTGPTAELMTLQPTDLSALTAGNGGTFPLARVVMRIDGRDPVLAHGSPMPIFGPFFEGEDIAIKTPAGQPVLTSRPVADLVAWLQTIQR